MQGPHKVTGIGTETGRRRRTGRGNGRKTRAGRRTETGLQTEIVAQGQMAMPLQVCCINAQLCPCMCILSTHCSQGILSTCIRGGWCAGALRSTKVQQPICGLSAMISLLLLHPSLIITVLMKPEWTESTYCVPKIAIHDMTVECQRPQLQSMCLCRAAPETRAYLLQAA